MTIAAWLILRIVYALSFLLPVIALMRNWEGTKKMVSLVAPVSFAPLVVLIQVVGALSIALGFYAQIGGILLCIYCLIGVRVHLLLGTDGDRTSAQKNFPLAALGLFFALVGAGPFSITPPLW